MLKIRATHWILAVALCTGTVGVGCGGGDDETEDTGAAGAGGGSAGKGGTAGKGGSGGGGTGGTAGKGGSGGGGTGGTAGKGGGGTGGGGTGGTAGKGGGGTGGGGTGGTAGKGGGGTGGAGGAGAGGAGAGGAGNGGTGGAGNGPVASVTATKVDFGNADCGGAAPGNQTVTIKNTGAADLKITASVSGASGFAIVGNGTITIPAGQSGTITVSATAVAGSATAGATIQGTLTLATNDPNNASIKLPITETPHGATLSWVTPAGGAADFGQQSVGKTSTTPLTLKNTGNADVQVAFGAPTSADFAVAPASGTVAAGGTFANLSASFTPASTGSASATSAIKTTGAICGTSASSLSLKGEGVKGTVTVSTSALDFGKNPCGGAAAAPQKITLTNGGTGAFSFTAANTNAAAYTLDPASGTVAAGATADITVTPAGIPFPSAVPGNYGDTITITTDIAGDTPKTVTVTEQALGAIVTANPTSVIFPGVPVNSTTTTTLSLQNVGNADAFLALGLDAGGVGAPIFGVTPATLTVGAGSTQGASVSFAPADNVQQLGGVTLGVDSGAAETVLCQPLPATVSLSGTGLNGGLGLDKSNIDFQQVPCGTKGTTQQLTLTNVGNAAFDFTGSLQGADASFFQVDAPTGTLAPGASITINVSANQLAQFPTGGIAPYNATLVLNSTIIGAQPVSVPITLTPSGAILAWGPPNPLDFGNVPASKSSTKDATLVNSGNAPANVTYAAASDPEFTAPSGGTAAVGNTSVPVKFAATTPAGAKTAKLSVATSDVLCAAPPADLTLTGTSTLGAYSDNGTNWFFGNDSQPGGLGGVGYKFCGTQAQPNTLKICNGGTADFTLTSLTLGTGGFYTATPSSNTVPANGGCVNVTLASNPIPFPLPVDAQGNYVFAFNDTLTVTTDIPLDTPHVYTLNQTAFGAIVNKMSPTALTFADTQVSTQSTFQYLLKNVGNARANLTFALANAPSPWFSLPSINNFAPGQQSFTATFTPTNAQSYADTASLVVGANTVLCDVLPPNTQNNGISLSGKGVPAGAGVFSLSPSAWTFGSVSIEDPAAAVGVYCGSGASADSHVFTISNSTVAAAGYTASVTGGYGLSSTSGTVGAGAQTQITVSTPAIGTNTTPGTHKDGVLSIVVGGNTYTATLTTVTAGTVFRWTDANGANTVVIPLAAAGIANGKTFNMVNDGNAEIDYFIDWGNTGGQVNRGSLWFYPYGPPGINNFQITQAAGSSIGDYVYAANDPGIIVGAIRPNPINKGVICNTNFQELAVVKN